MRTSKFIDLAIIISFALCITVPLLLSGRVGPVLITNTGLQSDLPDLDKRLISEFPARRWLTKLYYEIEWKTFHRIHDSVQLGKEGWLFYRWDTTWHQTPLQDVLGTNRATIQDRERWKKMDIKRLAWAKDQRTCYLCIIPPNKEGFYKEYLPDEVQAHAASETRLDSMIQAFSSVDAHSILDLRPALLKAKSTGQVYERTDTHWTQWGAYIAYRAILERLKPEFSNFVPLSPDLFTESSVTFAGDLSHTAWLEDVFTEKSPRFNPVRAFPAIFASGAVTLGPNAEIGNWPEKAPRILITTMPDQSLPTAVIFHDSFCMRLLPYLSQHFRRIVWSWGPLNRSIVEREHPDLLILERTERYLDWIDRE
jgi:alginate O-acetyltransferase complex protein AlgJ